MTGFKHRFKKWFFEGLKEPKKELGHRHVQDAWPKVMCLTGVDYLSSLGYELAMAYLAAGLLSPVATLFLVFVTLFGAVPIYRCVAEQSPRGEGSIAMLERLVPGWKGKLLVLSLLGFAATDFIITITLSAADAAQHVVANPYMGPFLHDRMAVTIFLIALLGAIFLIGFREAIGVAVLLVVTYLCLNAVVVATSAQYILANPDLITTWKDWVMQAHHSVGTMLLLSVLLFPKLA